MIVLDTRICVYWTLDTAELKAGQISAIAANESDSIGVNAISFFEIAKLVELGRLELPVSLTHFFAAALNYPGVEALPLDPDIAVEASRLPGDFHRDPWDQIIVATVRVYGCPLVTNDVKIRSYPHVNTI